ncbi:MAG: diadenylate cyclase CdaA [Acidobacteriota bacterium]
MITQIVNSLHLDEFGPRAAIEVAILAFLIYRLLMLIRGTRAVQMIYGLAGMIFLSWITGPEILRLPTLHRILVQVLFYVPYVIIVVFQNTIRRALTGFGANPLGRYLSSSPGGDVLGVVVSAAYALAAKRIGGLIVMEREQGLRNWTESGISLEALISFDLIVNVFSPYTPLHDGALIIADGRLKAASCFLPLTSNPALSTKYGTRHRAGIGITEETDAVCIIVSEERGTVSLAMDGVIQDSLDKSEMRQILTDAMESPVRRKAEEDPTAAPARGIPAAESTGSDGGS